MPYVVKTSSINVVMQGLERMKCRDLHAPDENPNSTATTMTLGVLDAPKMAKMRAAEVSSAARSMLYTPSFGATATGIVRPSVLPALRIAS